MRFDFFEGLSREEATAFLNRFLALESANVGQLLDECATAGVYADFTVKSVAPFMRWVALKVTAVPTAPDPQLPQWIRDTESYAKNLFEFDDRSKIFILRAAYYLGESFVRSHPDLNWAVGNPETAEVNMPVVAGFHCGLEMATILITENLLRRVIADPSRMGEIDKAIEYWNQKI